MITTTHPLTDTDKLIMHLVKVWRTAEQALKELGRPVTASNILIMFDEAALLARKSMPRLSRRGLSDVEHLTAAWSTAEAVLTSVRAETSDANMRVMMAMASNLLKLGNGEHH